MSGWIVVDLRPAAVHVMPCAPDGTPLPPHVPSGYCPCFPRAVRDAPLNTPILVHRSPGLGKEPFDA
jgi:hypothetical protein